MDALVAARDDAVPRQFRAALEQIYGASLSRVVLFGSRARGDSRPESDYDIAVFIDGYSSLWNELEKIEPIVLTILDRTGAVISAKPFPVNSYDEASAFMGEVRRDGVEL